MASPIQGKRKHSSTLSSDGRTWPQRKQQASSNDFGATREGSRNPHGQKSAPLDLDSGQRGAFPDLESYGRDEGLFYAPADDGMKYLRMVRAEAKSVPKLLTSNVTKPATSGEMYDESSAHLGYYEDGAYVGSSRHLATGVDDYAEDSDDDEDVQTAYYKALRSRFAAFRKQVLTTPALPDLQISSLCPPALRRESKAAQWSHALGSTQPVLTDLTAASQDDILRGLGRIESMLSTRIAANFAEGLNLGNWAWVLLAKSRDTGAMDSDSIAIVRQLGKRALAGAQKLNRKQRGLQPSNFYPQDEQGASGVFDEPAPAVDDASAALGAASDNESQAGDGDTKSLDQRKAAMLAQLEVGSGMAIDSGNEATRDYAMLPNSKEAITMALHTLDIIVTIVGEEFGQRDLLNERIAW